MTEPATTATRVRAASPHANWRSPYRHFLAQNAPLLLSWVILIGTIAAYVGFYYHSLARFPDSFDITSVINTALPLVFAALGQTVVVITRGLDLSVGGVLGLSVAIAATHLNGGAGTMLGWSLAVLAIGAAAGALNGVLVAIARLQPIVVTLATLSIFDGLAIMVLPQPGGTVPATYTNWLTNPDHPYGVLYVVLALLAWMVLRRSRFGIAVFAVGNDESAAIANGIDPRRTKVLVYSLSGLSAATGGLFFAATTTSGDATAGNAFVLTSIAAVVLGGISFFGGRGSGVGSVCGAFVLSLVVNVLFFAKVDPLYQSLYEGAFLIVAVVLGLTVGRLARTS